MVRKPYLVQVYDKIRNIRIKPVINLISSLKHCRVNGFVLGTDEKCKNYI